MCVEVYPLTFKKGGLLYKIQIYGKYNIRFEIKEFIFA
jgi:hypothetical protein